MSTDGSHQYEKAKKNAFLFSAQSAGGPGVADHSCYSCARWRLFHSVETTHVRLQFGQDMAKLASQNFREHRAHVAEVPTRDSISSQITEKNLLSLAAEPCAKLFALARVLAGLRMSWCTGRQEQEMYS
eukprot:s366_g33.t1